jgi:hypothetical protein
MVITIMVITIMVITIMVITIMVITIMVITIMVITIMVITIMVITIMAKNGLNRRGPESPWIWYPNTGWRLHSVRGRVAAIEKRTLHPQKAREWSVCCWDGFRNPAIGLE